MSLPAANYLSNSGRTVAEMKQALEDQRDTISLLPGGGARTELTIASGTVTPAARDHGGAFTIDTEGDAASDDLDTITYTNLPDGTVVRLYLENASRVVTLKHADGGSGEMLFRDSADLVLSDLNQWVALQRRGTTFVEIERSGPLVIVAGANVASASALPVLRDGSAFTVTGTTDITSIAAMGIGTLIVLKFSDVLTLTHHATNLVLPGGEDIVTYDGFEAVFREYAAGDWRLIADNRPRRVIGATNATTSGTSVEWTSIPAWVNEIVIVLVGVSLDGNTDGLALQIGDSGGYETSGYLGGVQNFDGSTVAGFSGSFRLNPANAGPSNAWHGQAKLRRYGTNSWAIDSKLHTTAGGSHDGNGSKILTARLDRVKLLVTGTPTDAFDSGAATAIYLP